MENTEYGADLHDTSVTSTPSPLTSRRYSDSQIEMRATQLLRELWQNREQMWGWSPTDPTIVIDPAKGLELLGYDFFLEEELSTYYSDRGDVQVAGVIDRESRRVHLSKRFPMSVLSFTAAHELGHALLHESSEPLHRDRPLNGESISRDPIEREADKFATFFLMPARLVKARFVELFGTESFALTEDSAFALTCDSLTKAKKTLKTRRDIARLLAGSKSYGGRNVYSLADQFRVSVEAMAIRLEELSLIREPIS
ncbi:ImmA/IrrE family metallo-endopeptidase [Mariprofundus sp. KV]|uniref:ImmA/IrrE family metallo-endopeptidase n=1 Tax=Mariprofundus sp. KV TaxID=2608715 RepID=UPI0015A0FCE2|nr:ImmA/IrrE family metallo-endopeptidase [Mariprofundus sp. KV]NWF35871.1 ImmA/IrrE family metallo-endopeptidase [Mariprofundus sp. KV]